MAVVRKKKNPKFVVAIDFGTTLSKAAYAVSPHEMGPGFLELDNMVHLITDWPCQEAAGGSKCFKTNSCVWYMPGTEPGSYEMEAWGWEAYVKYKRHVQDLAQTMDRRATSEVLTALGGKFEKSPSRQQELLSIGQKQGYLITGFKLWLVHKNLENLPEGLSLKRVISDFLKGMGIHIIDELRQKYGTEAVSRRHVKWCITVPAMWDEWQRQNMEDCAEMAGLVQGPLCTLDENASPYDLITVVEPEAASIYCHNTLRTLCDGDTFVVVDLGGGTMDLVTHKKIGMTTKSNVRVKEVSRSIGGLYGGIYVDDGFLKHLREVITTPCFACFADFEKAYPAQLLDLMGDWGRIKASFDGNSADYSKKYEFRLPPKLAKCWKRHYKDSLKSTCSASGRDTFTEIDVDFNKVKKIFDVEIDPILDLIQKRIVASVDFIIVVGGFSESPYVRTKIRERFSDLVDLDVEPRNSKRKITTSVIFPRNPDTAVVRGAVALGVQGEWKSFVSSRVSKRTYGFDTTVPFNPKIHPPELRVCEDDNGKITEFCDNIFHVFVRKGDRVAFDTVVEVDTSPLYREGYPDDENIEISLFSSRKRDPRYVVEEGVTKEATCIIPVPSAFSMTGSDEHPRLGMSVYFGDTRIRVVVWGMNFSGERIAMPPVRLTYTAQRDRDYEEQLEMGLAYRMQNRAGVKHTINL